MIFKRFSISNNKAFDEKINKLYKMYTNNNANSWENNNKKMPLHLDRKTNIYYAYCMRL
jgi:hypothetical protein